VRLKRIATELNKTAQRDQSIYLPENQSVDGRIRNKKMSSSLVARRLKAALILRSSLRSERIDRKC
jgi:hypothetical protein